MVGRGHRYVDVQVASLHFLLLGTHFIWDARSQTVGALRWTTLVINKLLMDLRGHHMRLGFSSFFGFLRWNTLRRWLYLCESFAWVWISSWFLLETVLWWFLGLLCRSPLFYYSNFVDDIFRLGLSSLFWHFPLLWCFSSRRPAISNSLSIWCLSWNNLTSLLGLFTCRLYLSCGFYLNWLLSISCKWLKFCIAHLFVRSRLRLSISALTISLGNLRSYTRLSKSSDALILCHSICFGSRSLQSRSLSRLHLNLCAWSRRLLSEISICIIAGLRYLTGFPRGLGYRWKFCNFLPFDLRGNWNVEYLLVVDDGGLYLTRWLDNFSMRKTSHVSRQLYSFQL
jgi:hypothetical protein